jgi:hypothetical protein
MSEFPSNPETPLPSPTIKQLEDFMAQFGIFSPEEAKHLLAKREVEPAMFKAVVMAYSKLRQGDEHNARILLEYIKTEFGN